MKEIKSLTALDWINGHVHTAAKFGCQLTFYSLIMFCTHKKITVKEVLTHESNAVKCQCCQMFIEKTTNKDKHNITKTPKCFVL